MLRAGVESLTVAVPTPVRVATNAWPTFAVLSIAPAPFVKKRPLDCHSPRLIEKLSGCGTLARSYLFVIRFWLGRGPPEKADLPRVIGPFWGAGGCERGSALEGTGAAGGRGDPRRS